MNADGPTMTRTGDSSRFVGITLRVLAAALLGSILIQTIHPVFQVPEEFHIVSMGASVEKTEALIRQQVRVARLNAMLEMAAFGGLVAMAFAGSGPGCCPLWLRTLAALPSGLLAGVLAAWTGIQVQSRILGADLPSVVDTVQIQAAMLFSLGLGIGVIRGALAGSAGTLIRTAIAAAFGGALAGAMFSVIGAIGFPASGTEALVPIGAALNLLWSATFAICVSLGLAVGHPARPSVSIEAPVVPGA